MSFKRNCRFQVKPPRRNGENIFLNLGLENGRSPIVSVEVTLGKSNHPLRPNASDYKHIINIISKDLDDNGFLRVLDPVSKKGMDIDGKAIIDTLRANVLELRAEAVYHPR